MNVVIKVRESLTPAFLTMVDLINEAKKNKKILSRKLCTKIEFNSISAVDIKRFICKKSELIH